MKRIGYQTLAVFATLAFAAVANATTPVPNDVKFQLNNWNTCPGTPVITTNSYPSSVAIEAQLLICNAFAEQHVWRFSADGGASVAQFPNNSQFSFGATLTLTGDDANGGETGINIAPWWDGSMSDGRINCRVPDGEIACFGGRMPFYSFTGANGVHFAMNTPLTLSMTYDSNGLSSVSPGTMRYDIVWLGVPYSSGTLAMDEANPSEDPPHGLWGILNNGNAGGFLQARMDPNSFPANPAHLKATWANVTFSTNQVTSASKTSWGQLKALYR